MKINDKARTWARSVPDGVDYLEVLAQIEYLSELIFSDYDPTSSAGNMDFLPRLDSWLDNDLTVTQQKFLFKLVPKICFVGSKEFKLLYESAYNGPIARWLMDDAGISFLERDAHVKLQKESQKCWICPATDSLKIADFYHVNNISGFDLRSDWRTLSTLGDAESLKSYCDKNRITRIVVLEDFVGSGSQIEESINFALTIDPNLSVLLCPLICCNDGIRRFTNLAQMRNNFDFRTVMEVPDSLTVNSEQQNGEPAYFGTLRKIILDLYAKVQGSIPTQQLYGAFGYRDTGSLLVMASNCPDNVPPLIHHISDSWNPIFPRSSRL